MVKAAERLYFAYDVTLDADQISVEEVLRSKHTHIKKMYYQMITSVFQWTDKDVCIKNRFILANESKVFPRQINQDKKISNKGSEFTCVVLRCV